MNDDFDDDDYSWSWDESHDDEPIVDSSGHLDDASSTVMSSSTQLDALPDDMGPESKVMGTSSDVGVLLNAIGWHPFMHFFVRLSNMLYGSQQEVKRPNILAYRHPVIFWFHLIMDELVQIAIIVILIIALAKFACNAVS